jgi:hypothetical protein
LEDGRGICRNDVSDIETKENIFKTIDRKHISLGLGGFFLLLGLAALRLDIFVINGQSLIDLGLESSLVLNAGNR